MKGASALGVPQPASSSSEPGRAEAPPSLPPHAIHQAHDCWRRWYRLANTVSMTRILALLAHFLLRDACRDLASGLRALESKRARERSIAGPLLTALILAEDRRFLRHGGVDVIAICRAVFGVVTRRALGGGSTVEQQLVRTLTNDRSRTLRRKIREILLAATVRDTLGKRSVAIAYLRVAYFGWRMNGVDEACRRLAIDQARVNPHEAAQIVARLKYPQSMHASSSRWAAINARVRWIARQESARRRDRPRRRNEPVLGVAEL